MNLKRILGLAAALVMLLCMMTACNPNTPDETGGTTTTTTTGADDSNNPGSDVTDTSDSTDPSDTTDTTASGDDATTTSASGNASTTAGSGTTNNGGANSGKTTTGGKKTTAKTTAKTTKGNGPTQGIVVPDSDVKANDYGIKSSTKGIEDDAELRAALKGKTVTMATFNTAVYQANSWTRKMKAFEQEYGCKLDRTTITFEDYSAAMIAAANAKKPYDIAYIHGYQFFVMIAANVYQPLNDAMTTADLGGKGKGIDLEKSVECSWNNKIYGIAHYYSVHPMMIFYNKVMFDDAGLEDPRELYDAGKWTWDKFQEMGQTVTDTASNIYFGDWTFARTEVVASYGGSPIKYVSGKPTVNIDSKNYRDGLQRIATMYSGATKIIRNQGAEDPFTNFLDGGAYVYTEEDDRYISLVGEIPKCNAFKKNVKNLGFVPYPNANGNKGTASGWIEVVVSPIGKNPKIAVAWQKFVATYKDPVPDVTAYSAADQKMVDALLTEVIPRRIGYESSSASMSEHEGELVGTIRSGGDISQAIAKFTPLMQDCIDATMSSLNKIQ